jgi:quinolinate synthase
MKNQRPEVILPKEIIEKALIPLERMFEMSK